MAWTCPLCGSSGRRNREDALPSWVLRYAEMQPGGPYVGAAYGRPYSGRRPPAFRVPVCTSCNGWMGRTFEEPAKRLLIPMFEGLAQTLKSDSQRVLAQWIAKSALMQSFSTGQQTEYPRGFIGRSDELENHPSAARCSLGDILIAANYQPTLAHRCRKWWIHKRVSRLRSRDSGKP
jgi:hypothetical protein